MLRFGGEQAPFLGVFGTKWFRFGEKPARFEGNWFGFWIGLRQSSSLTVLNTKHVWVWVSLKISQLVGSWKGKPANFDIEPVLC